MQKLIQNPLQDFFQNPLQGYSKSTTRFFQGFFRAVKRPQKLNLELSFETQSSHQSFSAVKMKLFELNS